MSTIYSGVYLIRLHWCPEGRSDWLNWIVSQSATNIKLNQTWKKRETSTIWWGFIGLPKCVQSGRINWLVSRSTTNKLDQQMWKKGERALFDEASIGLPKHAQSGRVNWLVSRSTTNKLTQQQMWKKGETSTIIWWGIVGLHKHAQSGRNWIVSQESTTMQKQNTPENTNASRANGVI